jgi:predicted RNase H-like nuclease (RuvC/YqgF family)|tara:strand:+ start:699 stop:950 length:252 start_codon:yes stop_codon:yes gene_type:complete
MVLCLVYGKRWNSECNQGELYQMNDKGYNDLEATIERLEFRNSKLHSHNEKIEQEIIELRKDNKILAKQVEDQIKQFRNTGAL